MSQPATSQEILFVDQFIELEVDTPHGPMIYSSQVKEIRDDTIVVSPPADAPELIAPAEEQSLKMRAHTQGGLFVARARALQEEWGPNNLLILREEGPWERVQRRWDVRLSIVFPPLQVVLVENGLARPLEATVLDLSGGGLQMQCKRRVPEGALLRLRMELPNQPPMLETDGEVVRVTAHQELGWGYYRMGVRFLKLAERDKDRIVRFIFQEQARRRRLMRR